MVYTIIEIAELNALGVSAFSGYFTVWPAHPINRTPSCCRGMGRKPTTKARPPDHATVSPTSVTAGAGCAIFARMTG